MIYKMKNYLDLLKLILKYLTNYIINFRKCRQFFKILLLIAVKEEVVGEHMFNYIYCQSNKKPLHKRKKLISSMFGEKILLYTPLLKWCLEHGLIITKFYEAIEYNKKCMF